MQVLGQNRRLQKRVRSLRNTVLRELARTDGQIKHLESEARALQDQALELRSENVDEANLLVYEAAQKDEALQILYNSRQNLVFQKTYLEVIEKTLFAQDTAGKSRLQVKLPKALVRDAEKLRKLQESKITKADKISAGTRPEAKWLTFRLWPRLMKNSTMKKSRKGFSRAAISWL